MCVCHIHHLQKHSVCYMLTLCVFTLHSPPQPSGIYTMEVFAEGFAPREVQFAIVEQNPTMLNVTLYPVSYKAF